MLNAFFTGPAAWFTTTAIIGGAFFVIRLLMMSVGLAGVDLHLDHGGADSFDSHHGDATDAFKVLSVQGVAGFLMGFGTAGLGALLGTGWSLRVSILVAVVGGLAMLYLVAFLLRLMVGLQSSGTMDIHRAVGVEGDVYLSIPAAGDGCGQVKIVIGEHQRILPAVSTDTSIPSQSRIRVLRVNDDRTLTVSPL